MPFWVLMVILSLFMRGPAPTLIFGISLCKCIKELTLEFFFNLDELFDNGGTFTLRFGRDVSFFKGGPSQGGATWHPFYGDIKAS